MSTTNKCVAYDNKDGKWKLTGNVYTCDDHNEKGLELLNDAVSLVKLQLQESGQPQVPPTPTSAPQSTPTTTGQDKWVTPYPIPSHVIERRDEDKR